MLNDDPRLITLDATVIKQLYNTVEETPAITIDRQKLYEIDHLELRALYNQASQVILDNGHPKNGVSGDEY